jgi:hypothetical protein
MLRIAWKFLPLTLVWTAAAGLAVPQVHAEEKSREVAMKEWLTKYHDANYHYVVFQNGQIFTARAKWTGVFVGRINLWHCLHYMPLRYHGDEAIYLRARVIHFLDEDAKDMAARYRTQCALKTYRGSPYELVANEGEAR